jgi:hypothetical protein
MQNKNRKWQGAPSPSFFIEMKNEFLAHFYTRKYENKNGK